jgi:hypothetical protein
MKIKIQNETAAFIRDWWPGFPPRQLHVLWERIPSAISFIFIVVSEAVIVVVVVIGGQRLHVSIVCFSCRRRGFPPRQLHVLWERIVSAILFPLQLRKESPLQRAPTDRIRFFSLWERIVSAILFRLQMPKESPLQRAPTDRPRFFSLWERIPSAISFIFFVVSEAVVVVVIGGPTPTSRRRGRRRYRLFFMQHPRRPGFHTRHHHPYNPTPSPCHGEIFMRAWLRSCTFSCKLHLFSMGP